MLSCYTIQILYGPYKTGYIIKPISKALIQGLYDLAHIYVVNTGLILEVSILGHIIYGLAFLLI